MNKLSFVSLAAVAACSGAPVVPSSPEIGEAQGNTQRQALAALQSTRRGYQPNGDFIYCTDDAMRYDTGNMVRRGFIPAGKAASYLEDETKHSALKTTGQDACYMKAEDKEKELKKREGECIFGSNKMELRKRKSPKPSTFSVPFYCGEADESNFTCTSFLIIKDIGKNDTGDDVCVRVGIEETELIPIPQTPLPEVP